MSKPIHVFLDLDQTLISAETIKVANSIKDEKKNKFTSIRVPDVYEVFHRPHLQQFLDYLFQNFTVSVWTAANKSYAIYIVKHIILENHPERNLEYILFNYHGGFSKNIKNGEKSLSLLWDVFKLPNISVDNTLIIDDNKDVYSSQTRNCILVPAFEIKTSDSENDTFLRDLQNGLEDLKNAYVKNGNRLGDTIENINKKKVPPPPPNGNGNGTIDDIYNKLMDRVPNPTTPEEMKNAISTYSEQMNDAIVEVYRLYESKPEYRARTITFINDCINNLVYLAMLEHAKDVSYVYPDKLKSEIKVLGANKKPDEYMYDIKKDLQNILDNNNVPQEVKNTIEKEIQKVTDKVSDEALKELDAMMKA